MEDRRLQKATFAAGCFWGVEETFRNMKGVSSTVVGYTGGHTENPSYKEVCTGTTGHAEAVEVTFDSGVVSYEELLKAFWNSHDPTTQDRQGPDIGSQYRSAIFYHSEEQRKEALKEIKKLKEMKKYAKEIATQVVPAAEFFKAEEYHQKYLKKNKKAVC